MPKKFTSKQQKIGELGEGVAVRYYQNNGYAVVERNYTKSVGEVDIVAEKNGVTCFIEVKSKRVTEKQGIEPGENMHMRKRSRLRRVIAQYLKENPGILQWRCDFALVYLNMKTRHARVQVVKDCII